MFINSKIESLISHFRHIVSFRRWMSRFEMQILIIVSSVMMIQMVIFNNVIVVIKIRGGRTFSAQTKGRYRPLILLMFGVQFIVVIVVFCIAHG